MNNFIKTFLRRLFLYTFIVVIVQIVHPLYLAQVVEYSTVHHKIDIRAWEEGSQIRVLMRTIYYLKTIVCIKKNEFELPLYDHKRIY